jgi:hypothetical protein
VFNQVDRLPRGVGESIASRMGGVAVSALKGQGLAELLARAERTLWDDDRTDAAERIARGGNS